MSEMKFDLETGEMIEVPDEMSATPETPEVPEQPEVAKQVESVGEKSAVGFDPMTGQPIYEKPEESKQPVGFDPMTGQPIYEKPEENKQPVGFDPMTGQPVYEKSQNTGKTTGFDPMTGKPIVQGGPTPTGASKKKGNIKLPVIIAIAAVLLLGIGVFAAAKSGAFLSTPDKILLAGVNTFKPGQLVQDLDVTDICDSGDFTVTFDGGMSDDYDKASVNVTCQVDRKKKQQAASGSAKVEGMNFDFDQYLDNERLMVQVPKIADEYFMYDFTNEKDGYLADEIGNSTLSAMDETFQTLFELEGDTTAYQKDMVAALRKNLKALKFEKENKKEFKISGKKRNCKGYSTTFSKSEMKDLLNDFSDAYENYCGEKLKGVNKLLSETSGEEVSNPFKEMKNTLDDMPDCDVTIYLYKSQIASIMLDADGVEIEVLFQGGDTPAQNMEINVDAGYYTAAIEKVGTTKNNKEHSEISLSSAGMKMSVESDYDIKKGDFECAINDGTDKFSFDAQIKRSGKKLEIICDTIKIDDVKIYGEISIEKGSSIKKPETDDVIDIFNVSEDELMETMQDASLGMPATAEETSYTEAPAAEETTTVEVW